MTPVPKVERGNDVPTLRGDGKLVRVPRRNSIWRSGTQNKLGALAVSQGNGDIMLRVAAGQV